MHERTACWQNLFQVRQNTIQVPQYVEYIVNSFFLLLKEKNMGLIETNSYPILKVIYYYYLVIISSKKRKFRFCDLFSLVFGAQIFANMKFLSI